MRPFLTILFLLLSATFFGQQTDYNTKKGYIAEGYDVVSYFTEKVPLEGTKKHQTIYEGAKFKFSSAKNLLRFEENPSKYIPQYGGYCAYAIAAKKTKMYIDAEAYEIRDDKLYLFYNSWWSNKLDDWQEENTKKLQLQGDENWEELKHQKN